MSLFVCLSISDLHIRDEDHKGCWRRCRRIQMRGHRQRQVWQLHIRDHSGRSVFASAAPHSLTQRVSLCMLSWLSVSHSAGSLNRLPHVVWLSVLFYFVFFLFCFTRFCFILFQPWKSNSRPTFWRHLNARKFVYACRRVQYVTQALFLWICDWLCVFWYYEKKSLSIYQV